MTLTLRKHLTPNNHHVEKTQIFVSGVAADYGGFSRVKHTDDSQLIAASNFVHALVQAIILATGSFPLPGVITAKTWVRGFRSNYSVEIPTIVTYTGPDPHHIKARCVVSQRAEAEKLAKTSPDLQPGHDSGEDY